MLIPLPLIRSFFKSKIYWFPVHSSTVQPRGQVSLHKKYWMQLHEKFIFLNVSVITSVTSFHSDNVLLSFPFKLFLFHLSQDDRYIIYMVTLEKEQMKILSFLVKPFLVLANKLITVLDKGNKQKKQNNTTVKDNNPNHIFTFKV